MHTTRAYNIIHALITDVCAHIITVSFSSHCSLIGGNWIYLKYVALGSVALGLPSIAINAFRTQRRFKFDVNCMVSCCFCSDFMNLSSRTLILSFKW